MRELLQLQIKSSVLFCFVFVTPEGFTKMVANKGLEKAKAYLNQVPSDQRLYIPSEGSMWCKLQVNTFRMHLLTSSGNFMLQVVYTYTQDQYIQSGPTSIIISASMK